MTREEESADAELIKEYLRDAFMDGALDLGRARKFLEGFLRIFAGEMEAIIALQHATYLEPEEATRLAKIAKNTKQSVDHFSVWAGRIHQSK